MQVILPRCQVCPFPPGGRVRRTASFYSGVRWGNQLWADVVIGPYETVEARTCTANQIAARIPHPPLPIHYSLLPITSNSPGGRDAFGIIVISATAGFSRLSNPKEGMHPPFLFGASDVTRLHFLPVGKRKKEKEGMHPPFLSGASDVTRTRDLLITSEMHYRLCYTSGFSKP